MKKIQILFALIFLLTIVSNAQNSIVKNHRFPQEKIFVHYNTNLILTGEKLYYKIYNLNTNNKPSSLSNIAYLEIIDKTNKSLFKQKLNLQNGVASSDLFIPTTIKTGSYKLIAYTQLMLNETQFFEDDIFIINPFQTPENLSTTNKIISSIKKNPSLLLSTNKKKYAKREKVLLSLDENFNSSISLSVRKLNPNDFPTKKEIQLNSKNPAIKDSANTFFIPELRGDLIHGKITTVSDDRDLADKKIGLSTIEEYPITLITKTNKNGEFYFNLKNNYNPNLLFQVLEKNRGDFNITIKKDNSVDYNFKNFPKVPITENIQKLTKERSVYLQIENSYNSVKQDKLLPLKKRKHIFSERTIDYILDDYKRFKTIKEVATEILNDVWYTQKGDQFELHVRDNNLKTNTSLPTLIIIDGYIVFYHNDIKNYDAMKIEKIALVKEKYIYGGSLYQGILNIKTFKNDYMPNSEFVNEITILKPENLKKYYTQDHTNEEKTKRIPDYRTQLLWKPNIKETNKEITFFTSDVTGDFEVEILGISSEGKLIKHQHYFTVE